MITKFKLFEKIITLNVKGQNIDFTTSYNKIYDTKYVKNLNLSYNELVDSGIWKYITTDQRRLVIGDSYSFLYDDRGGSLDDDRVRKCIGSEVICFNDKAGPYGGKPTITEGKIYQIYDYNSETKKIKIKNDEGRFIHIYPDRFCKTTLSLNVDKYNL